MNHSLPSRGFTLLLAVLVSSILLALGLAIYNIAAKEIILSSSGRDSQYAFYAADSGVECALYWDGQNAFASSSVATQITCVGQTVNLVKATYDSATHTQVTTASFSPAPCVDLIVTKGDIPISTKIESYGYNTCVTSDPRRIERAIRVQY